MGQFSGRLGVVIAVLKATGAEPERVDIDGSLQTLQALVGGWIEELALPLDGLVAVVNEDGRMLDAPINVTVDGEPIRGSLVVMAYDDAGEARSMTDAEVDAALAWIATLGRERSAN